MELTFLGATGTVTGSKYLLTHGSESILIDCGLFQGHKELRLRNWSPLPIEPRKIDRVILTHAHIDHSGYVPLLVKNGFQGKILTTPATKDLCAILLADSGYLQEEEAYLANKFGYSKHKPALPLYTKADAIKSLSQFETVGYEKPYKLTSNLTFTFHYAGHILGSAFVRLNFDSKSLLFTGDMGRAHDLLMRQPEWVTSADYLVIESTYGNREHESEDPIESIGKVITKTAKRGGTIVIPAFAVGRAQAVLYYISQLKAAKMIPDIPVFLDSPMAVSATNIFCEYANEHKLSDKQCRDMCEGVTYVNSAEDSKKLDTLKMPKIIISASGMATGGRVLFHIKTFASNPKNTIVFTGFQAGGTRGDRIIRGEQEIKIHGEMIPIRAEIKVITNTSAHADYHEILNWLSHFQKPPQKVFITHGEPEAALSLKAKIEETFGWICNIPIYLQKENL